MVIRSWMGERKNYGGEEIYKREREKKKNRKEEKEKEKKKCLVRKTNAYEGTMRLLFWKDTS